MVLSGISNVFPDFLEITAFDFVCQRKKSRKKVKVWIKEDYNYYINSNFIGFGCCNSSGSALSLRV